MISQQRFALARLLACCPTTSASSDHCAPIARPHSGQSQLRGLRLHDTDTDWSAGARADSGDRSECCCCYRLGEPCRAPTPVRAGVQTIIECSGIPRAEADQS